MARATSVVLWLVAVAVLAFIPGQAPTQQKKGVYRLEYVEVHRGYANFRKEDKLLTPTKDENIKGRPGKLEIAAASSWYASKIVLTVGGVPETVVEGQEVTLNVDAVLTLDVKEAASSTEPYVALYPKGFDQREEKTIAVSSKNPLKPGPYTLKVSQTKKGRVASNDRVFYTTTTGGRYARFTAQTRGGLSGQLILETTWFYKYDPDGTPEPRPDGGVHIAVRGDAVAGQPVTVTATTRGMVGQTLRLQLPDGVVLVGGTSEQKIPVSGVVTWQVRAPTHGQFTLRVLVGGRTYTYTLVVRTVQTTGKLPKLPEHIRQEIERLRQQGVANNWSFQIGQTGVSHYPLTQLCGFRVPERIDFGQYVVQVNLQGNQWLQTDRRVRDEFRRRNPDVLTELRIEARTQVDVVARKTRFDWRDSNKVTPVTSQGQCGSCWDFAALGAFECNYLIRNNATVRGSEQQVLDCSNAGNCQGGWHMDVFKYLIQRGNCPNSAYPYRGEKGTTCKTVTSPYKAVSWGFVARDGRTPPVADMKRALCEHGPLAVVMVATKAFQNYRGGVFNEHSPDKGPTHVVLIVGWDDSKGKNGCWAIRNSWDTTWGEQGFGWIEYGCNGIGDYAAWVEAQSVHYSLMTLLANDYQVARNMDVYVPLHLLNPTNVKNMDFALHYDDNVVKLIEPTVVEGNLPLLGFRANPGRPGTVLLAFAQNEPITTTGQLARLHFQAVGTPGSRTPLSLTVTRVDDPAGRPLPIKLVDGSIEIVKDKTKIPKGSCCGLDKLVLEDALCALEMSVKLRQENLNMDMDNSGHVDSRDAAIIIQMVTDQARTGQ